MTNEEQIQQLATRITGLENRIEAVEQLVQDHATATGEKQTELVVTLEAIKDAVVGDIRGHPGMKEEVRVLQERHRDNTSKVQTHEAAIEALKQRAMTDDERNKLKGLPTVEEWRSAKTLVEMNDKKLERVMVWAVAAYTVVQLLYGGFKLIKGLP